ncbi:MAG: hypothetical protein WA039_00030, partial [Gemmiger qucibialis]
MRLLVLLYSFFAETTSKILHFWPRGGVYFANGCKNAPAAAKSRARAFVFHNIRQYRIILSADTASEVRQMPSQKR